MRVRDPKGDTPSATALAMQGIPVASNRDLRGRHMARRWSPAGGHRAYWSEVDAEAGRLGSWGEGSCQFGPSDDGWCRLVQLLAGVGGELFAVGIERGAFGTFGHVRAGVDDLALAFADHVE